MRLLRRLSILIVAPTVALAFVVPQQGHLSFTRKASRILAAASNTNDDVDSPPPPSVVKTRRELRVEQLQQDIQRQLQDREELRLQLEQDIAAFEKDYEVERSRLSSVDVSLTKQIQRLDQVQNGGFQQDFLNSLASLKSQTPFAAAAALSGAAVVGRSVLVQQRERRLEQERLVQEEEIKRLMEEEEAQEKLIQTRRTALASVAGAGVVGTGVAVSLVIGNTASRKQEAAAPAVVVNVAPKESKPRPPEDDVTPSINLVDTPPPTLPNEETVPTVVERESTEDFEIPNASELSGAVSKALDVIPDATKLGDTMTAAFENVSGNTPVLAGVGVTVTAALVATLVGLFKDEAASDSTSNPTLTDLDVGSTKRSKVATAKDNDDGLDKSTPPPQNPLTPVAKSMPIREKKSGPVDARHKTELDHMDAKSRTETKQTETAAATMPATESIPAPKPSNTADPVAKKRDTKIPMEIKPTVQSEQKEETSTPTEKHEATATTGKPKASKAPQSMANDVSKASILNPETIVEKGKSVNPSSPSINSVDEKLDAKIADRTPTQSQTDTSKSTTATSRSSNAPTPNSVAESKQKDLKLDDAFMETDVLSSSDIQQIKTKVFGKIDDVSMDASARNVFGNLEGSKAETSSSNSTNDVAWKQDSFSNAPKPSDDMILPVTENEETEMKTNKEPNTEMAQASKSTTRSPARGFGKPVSAKSKRSKPSKH